DATVTARVTVGPTPGPLGFPAYNPYALTVSPKDGSVWVSNLQSGDVRVFDPSTMAMDGARTVFINGMAMFASFSLDGGTLYVPYQGSDPNALVAIDTQTLATRVLPLPSPCLNAHAFVLTPDAQN